MPIEIKETRGDLLRITVSGKLAHDELIRFQGESEQLIGGSRPVKLLIELDEFDGWEASRSWGDIGFMLKHDSDIEKIAVVGDPKWKDEMLAFLGAGLRSAAVRFFDPDRSASAVTWLG